MPTADQPKPAVARRPEHNIVPAEQTEGLSYVGWAQIGNVAADQQLAPRWAGGEAAFHARAKIAATLGMRAEVPRGAIWRHCQPQTPARVAPQPAQVARQHHSFEADRRHRADIARQPPFPGSQTRQPHEEDEGSALFQLFHHLKQVVIDHRSRYSHPYSQPSAAVSGGCRRTITV